MSLISKQIDELRAYAKERKGELAKMITDAADTIEELSTKLSASNMERSSQYYHGGWIPCSERLPEKSSTYLATVDYGEYGKASGQRFFYGGCLGWNDDAVVAWMPLPEPYRGGEEDESD